MMYDEANPRRLVVEGVSDRYAIAELCAKWVKWNRNEPPFYIADGKGKEAILSDKYVKNTLRMSGLEVLGIILDADSACQSCWDALKHRLSAQGYNALPASLPVEGLLHDEKGMPRLGVWIMPDNGGAGMLETFLSQAVPASLQQLFDFAGDSTRLSLGHGATYKQPVQFDKARLHCWLAWQDEPGLSLGTAVLKSIIDHQSSYVDGFRAWIIDLFGLDPL